MWFNGRTRDFHSLGAGSIPVIRSTFSGEDMTAQLKRRDETEWQFDHKTGEKLREFRRKAGLRMQDVYDMTGINKDRLCRIENGNCRLLLMEAMKLTVAYNISVALIFDDLWHLIEVTD